MTEHQPLDFRKTGYDDKLDDEQRDAYDTFMRTTPIGMRGKGPGTLHPDAEETSEWVEGTILGLPDVEGTPKGLEKPAICVSRRHLVLIGHRAFEALRLAVAGQLIPNRRPVAAMVAARYLRAIPGMPRIVTEWPKEETVGGFVSLGYRQAGLIRGLPEEAWRLLGLPPTGDMPLREGVATNINVDTLFIARIRRDPRDGLLHIAGRASLGPGLPVPYTIWQQYAFKDPKGLPGYSPPPPPEVLARYTIEAAGRAAWLA